MVGNQAAWDRARASLERAYDGVCTVYTYGGAADPVTHITRMGERVLHENVPCRISFKNNNNSLNECRTSPTASGAVQIVKLFISPDITVPKGSKIEVTQNNATRTYKSSGEPMIYYTHQEIILELFDKWT